MRGGRRPGAGRKPGKPDPIREQYRNVEAFARSVVEEPEARKLLRRQAKDGTLPGPLYQMLYAYAYGRPREQVRDDEAFAADLVRLMRQHLTTPEAKADLDALIETYTPRPAGLSAVA